MDEPTPKPKRVKPSVVGKGTVPGRPRHRHFPKHYEDFCQLIFSGHTQAEAAVIIGCQPQTGFVICRRPDVQKRITEIEAEYKRLSTSKIIEAAVLREQHLDEQIIDMAVNGEAGAGEEGPRDEKRIGRLKACELGYEKLRLIRPPNAQTIVALNMSKTIEGQTMGPPKLYQAQRFLKLRQGEPTNGHNGNGPDA